MTIHTSTYILSTTPSHPTIPTLKPPQHITNTEASTVLYKPSNVHHTKKTPPTLWWRKRRTSRGK
jgi:hypothetical protein